MPIPGPLWTRAEITALRSYTRTADHDANHSRMARDLMDNHNPLVSGGSVRTFGSFKAAIGRHTSHRGSRVRRRRKLKVMPRAQQVRAAATVERIVGPATATTGRTVFLRKHQVIQTKCPKCAHLFD